VITLEACGVTDRTPMRSIIVLPHMPLCVPTLQSMALVCCFDVVARAGSRMMMLIEIVRRGNGIGSMLYVGCLHALPAGSMLCVIEFDGFPMPEEYPMFPRHDQIASYLESFAERFELRQYIRFFCRVTHVEMVDQSPTTTTTTPSATSTTTTKSTTKATISATPTTWLDANVKWRVTYEETLFDDDDDATAHRIKEHVQEFDAIAVCATTRPDMMSMQQNSSTVAAT
jgi:hypothetical protein